jgi:RHS repeat-associated protein
MGDDIMIRLVGAVSLLFMLMLGPNAVNAQVATGTPPFSSSGGGPDVIDLANLNVHIDVPIINKPGRGMNFTYDMSYDSSVWYPVVAGSTTSWMPVANWGWRAQTEVATGYVSYRIVRSGSNCPNPDYPPNPPPTLPGYNYTNYVYHDSLGVGHPFNVTGTTAPCGGGGESGTATDGSGYVINLDWSGDGAATVTSSSGTLINPPTGGVGAATKTDRNGNQISVNGSGVFTDTLGKTVLTITGSGTATSPNYFTYTAPGGTAKFTMNYMNYTVATNFGAGITEYKSSAAVPLVTSIVLPDNSQYSFTYEPTPGSCTPYTGTTCTTARLASVTLPTGGRISYLYTGGSNGIFSDGSVATLTRTTPDGSWTYAQAKGTGAASTTTITDPQNNQSVVQFQGIYETQRQVYQGSTSGTLLATTNTCYNGASSPCNATAVSGPITQRSVITALPGSSNLVSSHVDFFNVYGVPTETDDYDYGSGARGALLRKILYTYAPLGNITAFRQQVTVQNGSGTTVSQTNYNYDETAATATSGTPQHISVTGSRGNLTSINYPVSGLTAHFTYYDTGTTNTATDVNGAVTTYNYNSSSCGNSFPIGVSEPLSLSRSMTWSCTGGVQTSATDENNQTTTYTYNDAEFWRINAITDPLNNAISYYYQPNPTYSSPAVVWSMTFNSGNSIASDYLYMDSLGRTYVDQRIQSPSASLLDSVSYTFDSNGRPYSVSLPCSVGWAGTCSTPKTTQTYDALNRPFTTTDGGLGTITITYPQNDVLVTQGPPPTGENSKSRQLEYDGLGRLTSVCEITGASGSGACGQKAAQTGLLTKYTYDALNNLTNVTQNAQSTSQQTRSYSFDAMSRLTSETNAESGTTSYTYDTDSTCGTSRGDLVKRVDAIGNVTCYSYDALHRLVSKTYPSGSYASVTPSKVFVYDSATVNGVVMANTKGRLAEAYTSSSSCTGKCTDIGFSYSVRGETSDVYESTQHSSGYYHITQSYWANGLPNQIGNNITSLPAFTYLPDPEGRVSQVTASAGQSPVTSTSYNSASLPTQVNYGSGDTDIFAYDPNTFRMQQFKFNVGTQSQSLTGSLTWNANSTLGQLAITDQFNGANTQTCNYTHDDLTRLTNANCGSAAAQTFSYDPFGNIDKSGSPFTFQPNYSASTNRMTTISSFTPTYDNNGNVLTDSLHSYAWDADGNSTTLDGVGLTFDALDRMVEQNRSGSYTQIVYTPRGAKLALMSGQSLVKAFIALPGQAVAVYTSSGLDHYRHSDWLGSARLSSSPSRAFLSSTAYAPFGETYAQSGTSDLSFTGQNSDTTSGDYDFLFREYSTQGRWPSPDPAGLAAVDPTNPQSWNRYAYVLNSPLIFLDPMGLDCVAVWAGSGVQLTCDPWDGGSTAGSGGGHAAPYQDVPTNSRGGGGRGGGNNGCVVPTKFQAVGIALQSWLAKLTNMTIGVGAGASAGAGNVVGMNFSVSRELVVSPNGQAAYVNTSNNMWQLPFNAATTRGYGGYGGIMLTASTAKTPQDLTGGGVDFGGGGGGGWGGGFDVSLGQGAQGQPVWSFTGTAGGGLGGMGHGATTTNSSITPICGHS